MTRRSVIVLVSACAVSIWAAPTGTASQPVPPGAQGTFAGGCFWCLEEALEKIPGVLSATSGYTGGASKNPTYEEVSSGRTGHTEAVRIAFDPARVTYEQILEVFWHNIDPVRCERAVLRSRQPVSRGHLRPRRAAAAGRRIVQAGHPRHGPLQAADRDRDRVGRPVLRRRGLSPGLLQKEPHAISFLQIQLRPRTPARANLGNK